MKAGRNTSDGLPTGLQEQAKAITAVHAELGVLLFSLSAGLPQGPVAERLAEQFAELELSSRVVSAGPARVGAVLDGKFTGIHVLVVLGDSGSDTEDQLMDLVHWLLANGRQQLAENLIFAQTGKQKASGSTAPAFARVMLEQNFVSATRKSGLRFPWAASSDKSWALAGAVLDYATGLAAE